MMDDVQAHSSHSGRTYPNWDALVAAEANGYVVIAVITKDSRSWPYVHGPYVDKPEAERARNRLRTRMKREQRERSYHDHTFQLFVRPAWKEKP